MTKFREVMVYGRLLFVLAVITALGVALITCGGGGGSSGNGNPTYTISGSGDLRRVGNGRSALMNLAGAGSAAATTDANGNSASAAWQTAPIP